MRGFSLFTAAVGVCLLPLGGCTPTNEYKPPPPPKVTVALPLVQTVNDYLEETGSTEAVELVQVRARVRGFIEKINFQPGEEIQGETGFYDEELADAALPADAASPTAAPSGDKDGKPKQADVLFVIEKQLYEAEVEQQQALLNIAQSEFKDADAQYRRAIPLAEKGVITQEELGIRKATMEVAKAKIESAAATLNEAKINLAYCDVVSPIDGMAGKPLVKLGNLVDGGEATHLVSVVRYDPIYVNFSISETTWQEINERRRARGEPELPRSDYPEIEMFASRQIDGDDYPFKGHLNYVALEIDQSTGTRPIRGIFPNPDKRLIPGMFVKVRVPMQPLVDALLVPEAAIGTDQAGRYVLIVNNEDTVERRGVAVGPRIKGMQVVRTGIQPSDRVVIDGLQRARVGGPVRPEVKKLPPLKSDGAQTLTDGDDQDAPPPKPEELDDSAAAIFEE